MSNDEKFPTYDREERPKLKQQLSMRLARLNRLRELDAPEIIAEKEKRLVLRAMIELSPDDIAEVVMGFGSFYKQYCKDNADLADEMEEADSEDEEEPS
jgi:hypothetical protein